MEKAIWENMPDGEDPKNPVRIYTDGVFDCFHFAHAKALEQCKKMFKHVYLLVGVCSDADTFKEKGKTIMTEEERSESVRHCKWADEVVFPGPWIPNIKFLNVIGAHYIAHDAEPYPVGDIKDVYAEFKDSGRFLATKRTEGISTTDIIVRIIKDYDLYLERNIKKGCTADELNVTKEKYFLIKIVLLLRAKKRKIFNLLKDYKKL